MPPVNITFLTATDIGTLTGYTAYTLVEDAFDGAVTQPLYFSYLPVAGDDMLEVYGYGNGTTYLPSLKIYNGPASAPTQLANNNASLSRPDQQDIVTFVTAGQHVFFEFTKTGGNVNPSPLTLRIARGQKESILNHDLYINDSSPGFPGIVMNSGNAIPKRYSLNYPAGEGQQTLRNGVVGVTDAFTALGVVLYDVASDGFTVRSTPTMPDTHYTEALGTNQIDTFWALRTFGGTHSMAVSITQDGIVGTPVDLGAAGFRDVQPQADNSAVYGLVSTDVRKITNPGGVVTTFLTAPATWDFGPNLLMMTDDTLLVPRRKAATDAIVERYSLSGVLLNTITLTGVNGATSPERIFADPDDPAYFWVWWQTSTLNKFQRVTVSTGALATALSRMKFVEGVSQTATVSADTVYSGADFSCVPIVLRLGEATEVFTIRRQRRFLLPSSDDNKRVKIPVLELLQQGGMGLTPAAWNSTANLPQGANPQVMMRISKDGGKTWGPERWRSAGMIGKFLERVRWLQATGVYRNAVCEITVTDPVNWAVIGMMGTPEEGSS